MKRDEKRDEEQRKRDEEQRKRDEARDEEQRKRDEGLNTEKKSMSSANCEFATPLLHGLGITWMRAPGNVETGKKNSSFSWDGGEEERTENAISTLATCIGSVVVDQDSRKIEFQDVGNKNLLKLKACRKESSGQSDVAIRFKDLQHDDQADFAFVIGIVEFKTDKAPLKFFQQLLELVAMSRISEYGQGLALLGTDLNTKWEVVFFDKRDHITVQAFEFGTVAIKFFREKLQSVHARVEDLSRLSPVAEMAGLHLSTGQEQDLRGFDQPNDDVQDTLQDLKALARHFNENYNANVTLPLWVQSPDAFGIYS